MPKRLLPILALLFALALAHPPAAGAYTPPGFFGMSPQGTLEESDFELMEEAGVRSVRLPFLWNWMEPSAYGEPSWGETDRLVELAAERHMRIFPFLCSSPPWIAHNAGIEPVHSARQRAAWLRFVRRVELRYGPQGELWRENPDLPYEPIRMWEIWNEENIVTFAPDPSPERYAILLRMTGRLLHRLDPGSTVLLGGLFGRPLQTPPNVQSGEFLSRVYRARNVKRFFDGVALHPYVAAAGAIRGEIHNLRRVMRVHHDAGTPIYVTEMGWGSAIHESRWERGPYGQAWELDRSFSLLAGHRRQWRIGGVWWFSWADAYGACQFCDSAGLLTANRQAKPAWYRFNAWTGGDSMIVPRATLLQAAG